MPDFVFTAKTPAGRTITGTRHAESETSLVSDLRREGLVVLSVSTAAAATKARKGKRGKVKVRDLAVLCRQLSAMMDAGLPVLESLEAISDQIDNATLAEVLVEATRDIEAGSTLSQALAKHERIFSLLFLSMIRAGEESGALPHVLGRLADYLEGRDELTRKIKSASTYPAFIAGFFVLAVVAIMFFLIPRFESIFADFDLDLPALTKFLIASSRFLGHNIIWEVLIIGLGAYAFWKWQGTPSGRRRIDQLLLRLPLFGKLVQKAAVARFGSTLSTLLENGVTVVSALEIVGETAGNAVVKDAIDDVCIGVVNGSTVSEKLAQSGVFPKMVVSMVSAGESSGNLPQMLEKLSNFYTKEVDAAITGLTAMIEPALIVGLGAVVTVVVLAIYLPIFQMATGIQ